MANSRCIDDMSVIHEIGEIQGIGYLFVVEEVGDATIFPSGMRIVGTSANVVTGPWIDVSSTAEFCGSDLGCVFRQDCLETIRSLIERHKITRQHPLDHFSAKANRNLAYITPFPPKIHGELAVPLELPRSKNAQHGHESKALSCTVSGTNDGLFLIELEVKHSALSARTESTSGMLQVADILGRVPIGSSPKVSTGALSDALIDMLPAYDRVMVYRFEGDGSGDVIHESIRHDTEVESRYLDLRFPATDIPNKARELLTRIGVRFIADTSAKGVPIILCHDRAKVVDLSMSALRQPSDCHLAYLKNMGVKSSLVVAIVVDGGLWGLYSIHSYTRVVSPSCEERIMVEMAATITSSLISNYQRQEISSTALYLTKTMNNFESHTRVHSFFAAEHKKLLSILRVDTIILSEVSRPVIVYGKKDISLSSDECKGLLRQAGSEHGVVFRSSKERGVAFFSVRSMMVAFVRGSKARQVKWAGKQDTPLTDEKLNHPRASFELYMEQAAVKFEPWAPATVDLLRMVRQRVSSHLYAEALPADVQEVFAQVSHQLRTPFHGVMGSLEMLREGRTTMDAAELDDLVDTALASGSSMMSTLNDILDIARDRNTTDLAHALFIASNPIFTTMDSMEMFASKNDVELTTTISMGSATASSNGPASSSTADHAQDRHDAGLHEVYGDERRIKHILQNLVNNAIKFTPSGGKVEVSLYAFDSFQEVNDWWNTETERFASQMWVGGFTDPGSVDNLGRSESEPGSGSGSEESSSRETQRWFVYCVEDSGIGILSGDLPVVVQPYRQISQGSSKSYEGTGLGLNICKNHVDTMHGGLGLASTFAPEFDTGRSGSLIVAAIPLHCRIPDPGSVESAIRVLKAKKDDRGVDVDAVVVDMARAKATSTSASPARGDGADGGSSSGGGGSVDGPRKDSDAGVTVAPNLRVLFIVVDDHQVNVKLMCRKLMMVFNQTPGRVKVLSATDGSTALEKVKDICHREVKQRPGNTGTDDGGEAATLAGIFMDYHMPTMDGIECTRRIRQMEAEEESICGFTADLTDVVRENFRRAGANDVIYKPWGDGQVEGLCNAMMAGVLGRSGEGRL